MKHEQPLEAPSNQGRPNRHAVRTRSGTYRLARMNATGQQGLGEFLYPTVTSNCIAEGVTGCVCG